MNATEVRDLIKDELWQASSTADVKVEDFKKLDAAAAKLTESEDRQEFKGYCEECLEEKNHNSIAIRYLATITGRHPMDDRHIFTVLEQYYEDSMWPEVIYLGNKILDADPFKTLDEKAVGKLIEYAVENGRSTRANLKCGICGEHGGDPASVEFCHKIGLNYVSCSPFRVPIARLAAAQAAIKFPRKK